MHDFIEKTNMCNEINHGFAQSQNESIALIRINDIVVRHINVLKCQRNVSSIFIYYDYWISNIQCLVV